MGLEAIHARMLRPLVLHPMLVGRKKRSIVSVTKFPRYVASVVTGCCTGDRAINPSVREDDIVSASKEHRERSSGGPPSQCSS